LQYVLHIVGQACASIEDGLRVGIVAQLAGIVAIPYKAKAPPKRGFREANMAQRLRPLAAANPASPSARSARVPGSGTVPFAAEKTAMNR
jgi:hypothetical protein